ncbi:hypothetical protein CC80DRAFT_540719 [Byssothecium circinans]|uniref:Aminoglycoside phosphotransferase domain-containing protein n=1 Tax=Byssothecium circinans TaxID=147558 RepID=A0A6A5T9B6_9PLEO|nr:hypothetical protein CC80DRAFT_540719 [Byssothecium circinans]
MTQPFTFRWTGQHNDEQSKKTYLCTDWDVLLNITKRTSGDPACVYQGDYHAGGRHIVRRIELPNDGKSWIARIPTVPDPFVSEFDGRWWTSEQQFTMESEIATMNFIAQTTDIPVPKVFGYKTCLDGNPVKLPYILMQCIEGNMIFDLGGLDVLTDEQNAKLRDSIASIQCRLADASLSKLGSLVLKPNGDTDISPLPASFGFEGPFHSMADYFFSWADHNTSFKNSHQLREPSLRQAADSFPRRLRSTVEKVIPAGHSSNYPIVHPDFQMHNLLLNDEYEIVGVIDWEHAHSAPIEAFAARTNMYAWFDAKHAALGWNEEGTQYLADIADKEQSMDLSQKLSKTFGSLLGDLEFWIGLKVVKEKTWCGGTVA